MQSNALPDDMLLSRPQVEMHFGISRRFLETSAVRGDSPPMVKIGRSVKYRVADLRKWIDAQRVNSTSEGAA